MFYRRRELRRLWEVEIFDGPPGPDRTSHTETIVAWNAVDATRSAGGDVAKPPKALHYVTWVDGDGDIYRINNTSDGPVGEPINPSVVKTEPKKEDWQ